MKILLNYKNYTFPHILEIVLPATYSSSDAVDLENTLEKYSELYQVILGLLQWIILSCKMVPTS